MKKFILSAAVVIALAGTTTLKAETIKEQVNMPVAVQDSVQRTPVKLEELPEAVKTTLQTEPVKSWTATEAWLVKEANGNEYYQINVKKEEKEGSIKVGKDGKIIEE
ncbi:MAG TPA: hypothetical protein VGD90_11235 [Sphingobacteriaceae bacterium]